MKYIKVTGFSRCGNIEFNGIVLPARREVCPRCDGEGKHVNPSIDGDGLSCDDLHDDPDFAESYFSGRFDVRCEECNGARVIDRVDELACRTKLSWYKGLIRYRTAINLDYAARMESYYECRAGA